jgi:hypothetical protein
LDPAPLKNASGFFEAPQNLLPYFFKKAKSYSIRASFRQSGMKQRAKYIHALAVIAFTKTVFKYAAQAGFFVKKFAWGMKINNNFTCRGKGTGVTAKTAAAAHGIPIFSQF